MNSLKEPKAVGGWLGVWAFAVAATLLCGFIGLHDIVNALVERSEVVGGRPEAGWANLIALSRIVPAAKYVIVAVVMAIVVIILRPKSFRYTLKDTAVFVALACAGTFFLFAGEFKDKQVRKDSVQRWEKLGAKVGLSQDNRISSVLLGGNVSSLPADVHDWDDLNEIVFYGASVSASAVEQIPSSTRVHRASLSHVIRTWPIGLFLRKMVKLQELAIESDNISTIDARDIAEHTELVSVSLGESKVGIDEIVAILQSKSIQRIGLRGTGLTDAGLIQIAARYDGHRRIVIVTTGTPITRDGLRAAKERCAALVFE